MLRKTIKFVGITKNVNKTRSARSIVLTPDLFILEGQVYTGSKLKLVRILESAPIGTNWGFEVIGTWFGLGQGGFGAMG